MNYEVLTVVVSFVLLVVTYLQYKNSKNNFLIAKLPIVNIVSIKGIYNNIDIKIEIEIENNGDSSAIDLLLVSGIEKTSPSRYDKIGILKKDNKKTIEITFSKNEISETLKLIEENDISFKKNNFKGALLPSFVCNIYYKNIYFKAYTTSYCKPIFHFIDVIDKNNRLNNLKIVNFLSDKIPFFSYDKISNRKYKKILKEYKKELPFEIVPDKNVNFFLKMITRFQQNKN